MFKQSASAYFDPAPCMTKFNLEYLAKFNRLEIIVITGPGFPSRRDYLALHAALHRLQTAVIKVNGARTRPMVLGFDWDHYYVSPGDDDDTPLIDQILHSQKAEMAQSTIDWHLFESLDKVQFSSRREVQCGWTFEEDEEYIDETDVRSFSMRNKLEFRTGYAVIDVVDHDESDISLDEDEDEDDNEA